MSMVIAFYQYVIVITLLNETMKLELMANFVAACTNPVDLVVAMDASGSITQTNFRIMQEFVRDLVYGLGIEGAGHNIGIATFATNAEVKVHLNRYDTTNEVLNAIDFLFTGGKEILYYECSSHKFIT